MEQQQIEEIAQTILTMTTEERQVLDRIIQTAEAAKLGETETKTQKITAIAQDIQHFEAKYNSQLPLQALSAQPPQENDDLLAVLNTLPWEDL